ncbi:MBL fold metallo-hydrolase [Acuticoccus sp. 2012]|uniref:MBL fold metallo-hydrolase n=2 Tax=Acuticoccus mangrovi TaxID=2796142 RepID=A0A934IIA9_9HYPH|nr:MBL fold metallo-hydrolase [Acuticoccus mangrovi]MBJ3775516.1 MBL fold metallo-hydrolase [Acuticoccus mangrovi]
MGGWAARLGRRTLAVLALAAFAGTLASPAAAQMVSNCQAIAQRLSPDARFIRVATGSAADAYTVEISYVGHSTFRITAPDRTVIATDFNGIAGNGPLPDVVTMNHAHSSHYTPFPDPEIRYVLRGWNPEGGRAEHFLEVGEVLIRNVPTDIRSYRGVEESGNSIFIFEIAGLCLGHLGHLHQMLSDAQIAEIGRLDIMFVPIDGTYTMNQAAMMTVVERLRTQVVIPMHWFGDYTLSQFIAGMREDGLTIAMHPEQVYRVSLNTLPRERTLLVLSREIGF